MCLLYVNYPKYGIDIMSYGYYIYLNPVFTNNNKSYVVCTSTHEKKLRRNMRLLRDLKKRIIFYIQNYCLPSINLIVVNVIIYHQIKLLDIIISIVDILK